MDPDRQVALTDPAVPPSIRAALEPMMLPDHTLWRCPRYRPPGSTAQQAHRPDMVIEWWLLDATGELVESIWELSPGPPQNKSSPMPHFLLLLFCLCVLAAASGMVKTAMLLLAALLASLFALGLWQVVCIFLNKT